MLGREELMAILSVGELARESGVHLETVRYYEREGLLPRPARKKSGQRVYAADTVSRLQFIKRAQALGFTLAEIKDFFAIATDPNQTCNEVLRKVEEKLAEVRAKIVALKRIERTLNRMRNSCTGELPVSACPIIGSLAAKLFA
jgi:Hg(II)-responsive transcriptional regulator